MLGYWLMSSMTREILKQIFGFDTSKDAWMKLEKSYASKSRAKDFQIKEEFQNLNKINLNISNELQYTRYGLFEDEKLMVVLGGLDESYDSVFLTIIERMIFEFFSIDDAKALLLTRVITSRKKKNSCHFTSNFY